MATRARGWEHRADHLLAEARERAERQPRWQGIVDLLLRADDVADALEESAFVHTLVRQPELVHPPEAVQAVMLAAPTTHFVELGQAILFRGAGLDVVWVQFVALAGIGALLFAFSLARFRAALSRLA